MAIYSWFTHWKWWFSIAMLVYQRVVHLIILTKSSSFHDTSWTKKTKKNCHVAKRHEAPLLLPVFVLSEVLFLSDWKMTERLSFLGVKLCFDMFWTSWSDKSTMLMISVDYICPSIHSFIHSFIHQFIHSFHFIHSFIHSFHSFISFIHSFISFIHSFISFIHSFISFIHSFIHFIHFIHSFISFIHSCALMSMYAHPMWWHCSSVQNLLQFHCSILVGKWGFPKWIMSMYLLW